MKQALSKGTQLDNGSYTVLRVIGKGGFAITYLAKNRLGKQVAIKEFFPDGYASRLPSGKIAFEGIEIATLKKLKDKFRREGEILLAIEKSQHPNIVKAIDLFEENNTLYLVLEYIEGDNLKTILDQKGSLSIREANDWILQIGSALSLLHSQQFYHLDIKPSNILVNERGQAVLIDFGLSKHGVSEQGNQLTSLAYSFSYAPPEQRDGSGKPNARMDIYAFGATCLFLLTGKIPKETQLAEQAANLPSPLKETILKAMAYKATARPKSIHACIQSMGLSDESEATVYVNRTTPSVTTPTTSSSKGISKMAYGVLAGVIIIAGLLFMNGMIPNINLNATGNSQASMVGSGNSADDSKTNTTKPSTTNKNDIKKDPEKSEIENSPSNETVTTIDKDDGNNRDEDKTIRPKKPSMTSFKGTISSSFQGTAQTIQLALKKSGKNNAGLDKVSGYCTIKDAKDSNRYIKISLSGTYDADGQRLRLQSGEHLNGKNMTYCSFNFSSFYKWGTSEFTASFSPKRDLRNKTECDNLRSSAKINVTKI